MTQSTPTSACALDQLHDDQEAIVVSIHPNDRMPPELVRRLIEIGFLPGERVSIVARGVFGGSPLAVRVGTSTFALRQAEAQCVQVAPQERTP